MPKPTTIVLGTFPHNYDARAVSQWLDSYGYRDLYDVVHVPMLNREKNRGYAFVNFLESEVAAAFCRSPPWRSLTGPWTSWAKVQGYSQMLRHLESSGALDAFSHHTSMPVILPIHVKRNGASGCAIMGPAIGPVKIEVDPRSPMRV